MAMHQITDRVWLGSITAVGGTRTLKKHNVTHILSLLSPDINAYIAGPSTDHTLDGHVKDFKHLRIDIDDVEDENIMQYFAQTNEFIDDAVKNGGSVLVHCMAGVSRSATAVMAYLMRSNFWTRDQAYNHVKSCRPVANPNSAFFEQLQIYYECGFDVSDDKPIYRQYLLKLKAEDASTGVAPQAVYSPETGSVQLTRERLCFQVLPDILRKLGIKKGWETCRVVVGDDVLPLDAPFPRLDPQSLPLVKLRLSEDRPDIPLTVSILSSEQIAELRCKKCRQLLGTSSQLILHTPLTNIPSQNTRNGMSATSSLDPSCTSYFMEPVSWMRPELEQGKLEGKFACPRCQSKLGAYHWQGAKCSCGTWVTPGITIQRGRVDEAKRVVRAKA